MIFDPLTRQDPVVEYFETILGQKWSWSKWCQIQKRRDVTRNRNLWRHDVSGFDVIL